MHRIDSPKRLIGAAALACAAALIPVAALAATAAPAAPAAAARPPSCATSGLVVWVNGANAGTYHMYYTLNFTNLSGHACTLRGTPGVSAVNLSGQQLGRPADGNYSGHAPAVRLANGATAQAQLSMADISANGGNPPLRCRTVTAAGLRVYPPGQFTSKVIPMPFSACSSRTGPVWMSAQPVQKG